MKKEMKTTSNSREYNILNKRWLMVGYEAYSKDMKHCQCGCPMHIGECTMTRYRKIRSSWNHQRCWKRYRKKQYKGS